jgi:hypothetical protein
MAARQLERTSVAGRMSRLVFRHPLHAVARLEPAHTAKEGLFPTRHCKENRSRKGTRNGDPAISFRGQIDRRWGDVGVPRGFPHPLITFGWSACPFPTAHIYLSLSIRASSLLYFSLFTALPSCLWLL